MTDLWVDIDGRVRLNGQNGDVYLMSPSPGNAMTMWTAGAERMRIDADGKVGIGTTGPTHQLTLGTPETPVVSTAKVGIYSISGAYLILRDTTNDIEGMIGVDTWAGGSANTPGTIIGSMTNHLLALRTNNNTRMIIDANGKVGIGTTSPGQKLEVYAPGVYAVIRVSGDIAQAQGIEFYDTQQRWFIHKGANSADLRFWDGANRVTFKSGGNVGIGIVSPQRLLHLYSAGLGGAALRLEEPAPRLEFTETGQPSEEKNWEILVNDKAMSVLALSDNWDAPNTLLSISREGSLDVRGKRFYAPNIAEGDRFWFAVNGIAEPANLVLGLYSDGPGNNKFAEILGNLTVTGNVQAANNIKVWDSGWLDIDPLQKRTITHNQNALPKQIQAYFRQSAASPHFMVLEGFRWGELAPYEYGAYIRAITLNSLELVARHKIGLNDAGDDWVTTTGQVKVILWF